MLRTVNCKHACTLYNHVIWIVRKISHVKAKLCKMSKPFPTTVYTNSNCINTTISCCAGS